MTPSALIIIVRSAFLVVLLALAACAGEVSEQMSDPDFETPPQSNVGGSTCGEQEFRIARAIPDVLIALDRSGSMPGAGLWDSSRSAIYDVTAAMDAQVRFGLAVFPTTDCATLSATQPACDTSASLLVPIDHGTGATIRTALSPMQACGATPTAAALAKLRTPLQALPRDHTRAILLVTDGAPNCNAGLDPWSCVCTCGPAGPPCQLAASCLDDAATYKELDALCAAGIRTYVLGLGAAFSNTSVLVSMAQHGCTGTPFAATDPASVKQALQQIAGKIAFCSFDVDCTKVQDSYLVNFYLDGALLRRDSNHAGGWDWTTQCKPGLDKGGVQLFGAECAAVKTAGVKLTAKYGCATAID